LAKNISRSSATPCSINRPFHIATWISRPRDAT
jgi:hypothetical protein